MKVLITSCGRLDLLKRTLRSLLHKQQYIFSGIVVHEDSPTLTKEQADELNRMQHEFQFELVLLGGVGQHKSIEKFLSEYGGEYYLHVEDDWEFDNSYNWVQKGVDIMNVDLSIMKVLCRKDSPHPCEITRDGYGFLHSWENDGILWYGFSWNPGVTNVDALRSFTPFKKWEQELAEQVYFSEYNIVSLENGVCTHIGEGRSTHE